MQLVILKRVKLKHILERIQRFVFNDPEKFVNFKEMFENLGDFGNILALFMTVFNDTYYKRYILYRRTVHILIYCSKTPKKWANYWQ